MRTRRGSLAFLILLSIAIALTSCAQLQKMREDMLSNDVQKEKEAMYAFEDDFFQALEKEDRKGIKNCFSKFSKAHADDWDEAIDYLFTVYTGGKIKKTKDSNSSYKTIEKKKNSWTVSAYCQFTADGKEYQINWTQYLTFDEDPDMIGVYSLSLVERGEQEIPDFSIAGIFWPGKEPALHAISTLHSIGYESGKTQQNKVRADRTLPDESSWKDLFDDQIFASLDQSSKNDLILFFMNYQGQHFKQLWIEERSDAQYLYSTLHYTMKDGVFGMKFNEDGKITGITMKLGVDELNEIPDGITGFEEEL
jgi:hypothetical protein